MLQLHGDWLCNRNRVQRLGELASVLMVRVVQGGGGVEVVGIVGTVVLMFQFLPGDHRTGLWLARGGGGSAELREATVTWFQAGHRTPESRDRFREDIHKLHISTSNSNSWATPVCQQLSECILCADADPCSRIKLTGGRSIHSVWQITLRLWNRLQKPTVYWVNEDVWVVLMDEVDSLCLICKTYGKAWHVFYLLPFLH